MSATPRGGDGRPIALLAGLFLITLGSCTAWGFMRGHGTGHSGGFGAVGHGGAAHSRGHFASGRFAGHRFGEQRHVHGHQDRRHFFPYFYAGFPYYSYVYEDEAYEDDAGYPDARRSRGPGYCDVSPHSFPQYCVWKDRP